jgi:hypothetical protein
VGLIGAGSSSPLGASVLRPGLKLSNEARPPCLFGELFKFGVCKNEPMKSPGGGEDNLWLAQPTLGEKFVGNAPILPAAILGSLMSRLWFRAGWG